jgi:hypothetical protein
MSHHSRKTTMHDVKNYIATLKYFRITTFYFNDIPTDLKNISLHNAACMLGLFKATGKGKWINKNWVKEWTIL